MSITLERIIFYTLLVLILVVSTPYGIVAPWRGVTEAVFECGICIHSMVDFGLHIPINALICLALVAISTVNTPLEEGKFV